MHQASALVELCLFRGATNTSIRWAERVFQLDLQEITVLVCVYVKNINRIYCSEASVHGVFFVLVLWYGRGLQSAKEKAAFNFLQLRRTVVYELSNCDPHMPETPWNTYLLPVNYG